MTSRERISRQYQPQETEFDVEEKILNFEFFVAQNKKFLGIEDELN